MRKWIAICFIAAIIGLFLSNGISFKEHIADYGGPGPMGTAQIVD